MLSQKIIDQRAQVLLAHEAAQTAHLTDVHQLNARLVRKTQDGTLGRSTGEYHEATPVGIHIGDTYQQSAGTQVGTPGGASTLVKVGAMGAALLTGSGVGLAAAMLLGRVPDKPSVPVAVPVSAADHVEHDDMDTRYTIEAYGE